MENHYKLELFDVKLLKKYYMPFIKHGGMFIPTKDAHPLNARVSLELTLPQDPEVYKIEGHVIWINPEFAQQNREQGIGIQFEGENNLLLKDKIEKLLAGVNSNSKSATM